MQFGFGLNRNSLGVPVRGYYLGHILLCVTITPPLVSGHEFAPLSMNVPLFRYVSCLWLLVLLSGALHGAETASLETVEKAAGDWLKVRAETSRLETEWTTQRQLLDSMVHGLTERAQSLEVKRDYLRTKTAKDRDDLAALENSNKAATAGLQSVEVQLKATSMQLLQLRRSLPPRLSDALAMSYKSLAEADLTLGVRMQLTMTILNRCQQFNRSITCEEEILSLSGEGTARQLEVIYWGMSHAYALDRSAGKVWFGSPGPEGWQWEPIADAADRVAKLMAIYRGKSEPEFVEVPVGLKSKSVAPLKK